MGGHTFGADKKQENKNMKNILRNSNFGFKNRIMRMALLRSEPRKLNRSFGGLRASLLLALTVGWMGGVNEACAARLAAWDFFGESSPVTSAADVFDASLDSSSSLNRGLGAASSSGGNSFRTQGFQNNGIATSNTDYFQFTLSAVDGKTLSLSTIDARFVGTTTFFASPGVTSQFAYSLDGNTFTLIGSPVQSTSLTLTQISLSGISALQNIPAGTTVTIRYYASGQTTGGGWGFSSTAAGAYGLDIGGTINSASAGAPGITSPITRNAVAYDPFTYQIEANNSPTSFNAIGLPSGLSVDTARGIISGTPTTPGNYSITISAANADGSGSATLALSVTKNPGAPTITSLLTASTPAGSVFSYVIEASNTPTSFTSSTLPIGLTLDPATGIISGTPTTGGVSNIILTAINALGQDAQTLVLTTTAPPTVTSSTSGSLYEGGTFSYKVEATATPAVTAYGATGLPDGLVIDPATGIISGSVATAGTYSFTVSAENGIGVGTATYTLRVLSQVEQDAIPFNVVINKYLNTPDTVELLVIGNGNVGSTADLRGMILKDFSSSSGSDNGGKFQFSNDSLWSTVKAGTLIVLLPGTTGTEDLDATDFVLRINLGNVTYFTSGGGTFDIGGDDMVLLKAAGTGFSGFAGGVHALAAGTVGAQYNAYAGKKLRPASGTTAAGFGVRAKNSNSQFSDYYGTSGAAGTDAEANIALASLSFGSFNTAGNDSFIKTLRGVVDGSGLVSIVNGLSGSRFQGQNVFPRNELGQTVEIIFTPSSTATAIQQLEIDVPALFGVPSLANVTLTGTDTSSATVGVAGQKVTVSGMSAVSPNPVTIKIAGLSTPDTSANVSNNGAYSFAIRSAGVGGSLASLGVSPIARVMIPIANLKNVDPTTKVPILNGQTVAVEGVCLVGRLGSGNTYTVLQEGTAGVQVYSLSAVQGPQTRGNKYVAVGAVGLFGGITQITVTEAALMFDQGAGTLPAPAVVTVPVFNAAGEDYENRLIRIENLTYVSGTFANGQNVVFKDANNVQVTIRIQSASTATARPLGAVTITGIGGQFDNSVNYDSGYQLQPRDVDDMPAPPSITTTTFAGTVGEEFSAKIASVGSPAITAGAGLPVGLSLESAGFITGTPEAAATSGLAVSFTAINAYGSTSASITFTIAKGTPTIVTPPTASAITEGQTLVASTFTGGSVTGIASTALSGTFGWSSPTFAPPLGTASYGVVFTPSGTDANNWNVSSSTTVSVTVDSAGPVGTTYSSWRGAAPASDAAFWDYVYGATAPGQLPASLRPTAVITGENLVLTYYVRQNTLGLTVTAKKSLDLATGPAGWNTDGVTDVPVDGPTTAENGVSVQKRTASVAVSGANKKFLKLEGVQAQ